jgi:hypothetical protein
MPTQKDLKRLVRRRMQKTGESYTTARSQLLRKKSTPPVPAPPAPPDYARLAGISDTAVKAATGCGWDRWVYVLDRAGAPEWPHRQIAEHVQRTWHVPDWWTQTVTVGYERIKGLREIGQRRGGTFEANKSRTIPVPVERLHRAFADARIRNRWLTGIRPTVRTSTPARSVRLTWPDGTSVEAWFMSKGKARSSVQVAHRKLSSRADAEERKAFWADRLDALSSLLTEAPARRR